MYDAKCRDLAEVFVDDWERTEGPLTKPERARLVDGLSQEIQDAIDGYIFDYVPRPGDAAQ